MSTIDARKDAFTVATNIFKILEVEVTAEKLWQVVDAVLPAEDRADSLEGMADRMSETIVDKNEEIYYLKEKIASLEAMITTRA